MADGPQIPNPCSKDRAKIVDSAFRRAKRWLRPARRNLQLYLEAPNNTKFQKVEKALEKHFRWSRKQEDFMWMNLPGRYIIPVMDELIVNIDQPHYSTCYIQSKKDREMDMLFANVVGNFGKRINHFGYAPRYFNRPGTKKADLQIIQAGVVIHEMLHSWRGWMDSGLSPYENDPGYPGKIGDAVQNPDSYANLIRDIRTLKKK